MLSASLSRALGGVFEAEKGLARALAALPDTRVAAYGLLDADFEKDAAGWPPVAANAYPRKGPAALGWSPALGRAFMAADIDVAHLHALWTWPSALVRDWGDQKRKPYITSIHGMMEPWALARSGLKKKLALMAYEGAALRGATCLHALTGSELADIRRFGLKNPVCVIPNGVDLPASLEAPDTNHEIVRLRREGGRVLLYLGRLHPKKNLPALIEAFGAASARHPDWVLAIAGWDQEGHREALEQQTAALGLAGRVRFIGPQFGDAKSCVLAAADGFILPSLSEGLPMAVLEAWSFGKPVMMTEACNLPEGFAAGAALKIGPDAAAMAPHLAAFMALPDDARADMGAAGRALVEQQFTWAAIASRFRHTYAWALGEAARPDFVELGR